MRKQEFIKRLNMVYQEKRLESFKCWPYKKDSSCSTQAMAEAGFFWTGTKKEPNSAQCFLCNKNLDGWEINDDPWLEHRSHSEKCSFALKGKQQDDIKVKELVAFYKEMIQNIFTNFFEQQRDAIDEFVNQIKNEISNNYRNKSKK